MATNKSLLGSTFCLVIFVSILSLISGSAFGIEGSRVDTDLKIYDDHVQNLNKAFEAIPKNPLDISWVKLKLGHMVEVDQFMRKYTSTPYTNSYTKTEMEDFWKKFALRFQSVDSKNTADLKELLKIYEWFTISKFGIQADRDAWLLVQHADQDFNFQKSILAILTGFYKTGETSPANYAYLFDRVAASWGNPSLRTLQRFGTQGTCLGPMQWKPIPMEDPAGLDARRKSVGLGPQSEYLKQVQQFCH